MRISILSLNGVPLAHARYYDFETAGGGIGREDGNELVLPDEKRHISRLQARVLCIGGQFFLEDRGANPSSVNDRPVGQGNRVPLSAGDRIAIGGYLLQVDYEPAPQRVSTPARVTPTSDPLGLSHGGAASWSDNDPFAPQPAGGRVAVAEPLHAASSSSFSSDDPFAVFKVASPASQDLPGSAGPLAPARSPATPSFDPLGLGLERNEPSVDELFGSLHSGGTDPFAGTPLSDTPSATTNGSPAEVNPLALFGKSPSPPLRVDPQRDDAPLLHQAFQPPTPQAPASSSEMVLSWDLPSVPQKAAARIPVSATQAADSSLTEIVSSASVGKIVDQPPVATDSAISVQHLRPTALPKSVPAVPATPAISSEAAQDLLSAFQRGLGVPINPPAGMTPALLERIGSVLRQATQGTVDLLAARELTKREVHAEQTTLFDKRTNPLKISPDVDFVLLQLLTPQGRFMPPEEAMRDVYNDLRAHQFGVMAGMRAALDGVLKRFEPKVLEERVVSRHVFDNLLPGSRKARLWDLFEQMYGEISREAEDDFHALFGREFLRAYEDQVERLQKERAAER
ncbi:MAG TPA: type VI secretion system-associated FHA domain protein TagH [Accumulibacter sp.]|nr:type VI secretion system-associated FHA domain protein TagH [Accumulibacter sp.]